jgi:hypothetical protein
MISNERGRANPVQLIFAFAIGDYQGGDIYPQMVGNNISVLLI